MLVLTAKGPVQRMGIGGWGISHHLVGPDAGSIVGAAFYVGMGPGFPRETGQIVGLESFPGRLPRIFPGPDPAPDEVNFGPVVQEARMQKRAGGLFLTWNRERKKEQGKRQ